jgi:hypothetical protein
MVQRGQVIPSHTTARGSEARFKHDSSRKKASDSKCGTWPMEYVYRNGAFAIFRDGMSLDASGAYVMMRLSRMQHSASCNVVRSWIRFDRLYYLSFARVCLGRAGSGMRKSFRPRRLDHTSIILYCCQIKGRKVYIYISLVSSCFPFVVPSLSQSTSC